MTNSNMIKTAALAEENDVGWRWDGGFNEKQSTVKINIVVSIF